MILIHYLLNKLNSDLIKNIYRLNNEFEDMDITLYGIDVINTGIKSNSLLGILFLNIFENSRLLYKTKDFKLFIQQLNDIAEKNREFNEKYKELGRSYAMIKDIMNFIKKSVLLENYNIDV